MTNPEEIDIENIEGEVKESLNQLGPVMIGQRIQQDQLLMQSAAAGGPTSVAEAMNILLKRAGIGVRHLARDINVSRKPLQQMLNGEREMSADIISKIYDQIEKVKPGMIDSLAKMQF